MNSPEFSSHHRSEALSQSRVQALMDDYRERLFVHGDSRPVKPGLNTPREIQFDFNTKAVQRLLEQTAHDDGMIVAEAYAVYEREGEAAAFDQRETQDESVVIIINKLLTASPANNPISQHSWYTFTSDDRGHVDAQYAFEFVQGGRMVMDTTVSTTVEEQLFQAVRGTNDRRRQLFGDDERLLKALLDMIGR